MRRDSYVVGAALSFLAFIAVPTLSAGIDADALQILQQAEAGASADSQALAAAWKTVAAAAVDDVPSILAAFDDATPIGANWLSSAIDRVLEQAASQGEHPVNEMLAAFVGDSKHASLGRETALEILRDRDSDHADAATAALIDDPSARLRRGAVGLLLETC